MPKTRDGTHRVARNLSEEERGNRGLRWEQDREASLGSVLKRKRSFCLSVANRKQRAKSQTMTLVLKAFLWEKG